MLTAWSGLAKYVASLFLRAVQDAQISRWLEKPELHSWNAAEIDAARSIPPGAPHGVRRDRRGIFLASGEQFPSKQPAHRSLRRTLRQPDGLGQFLITHLNGSVSARLFGGQPQIDKKAGGSAIMPDQVAHQHVDDVIIQVQHGYTGH